MERFSVYNYKKLSDKLKFDFNKSLAQSLTSLKSDIESDDVLRTIAIEDFILSSGTNPDSFLVVSELYCRITGSIQAGSGNQLLFISILNIFTDCWNKILHE